MRKGRILESWLVLMPLLLCFVSSAVPKASGAQTGPGKAQVTRRKKGARRHVAQTSVAKKTSAQATERAQNASKQGANSSELEVAVLKEQLAVEQKQLEQLQAAMQLMQAHLDRPAPSAQAAAPDMPNLGQVASLAPAIPAVPAVATAAALPVVVVPASGGAAPASQAQIESYTKKVDQLDKTVSALNKGLAGFKLSGDFRLRSDNIFRSANSVAAAQQNVRARYRLRFNVDKAINDQTDVHLQLGSGTFNNPLTFDNDFNGTASRGPIFLSEAWAAFHPNKTFEFRGGKMADVFADNSQFMFDDDIRLNGFQQVVKVPFAGGSLGKVTFELRAGQYIFTNPNVQILPTAASCAVASPAAACAYLSAGYLPGQKVRATDLFHQGLAISASPSEHWKHQVVADWQIWRNPNSIQLASVSSGYALLGNTYYGVALSGAISGTGNGTTTSGGAKYTASHFQIGRVGYRIDYNGLKSNRQNFPVYFDFQGARNFGSSFYNNAFMGAFNVGETKKFGDVLFRYAFYYKEANALISQVTDDDVGTNTGVNLKTHAFRFDIGLNKYVSLQNRIYIQDELAGNDPARHFYVTLRKGADTQYRYQGQLLFTF